MEEIVGIGGTSPAATMARSIVDEDDTRAGYVDVEALPVPGDTAVAPNRHASSPLASTTGDLRMVQQVGQVIDRIVNPTDEVPRALPEESFPSPRRRVTPTSATRNRPSNRVIYDDLVSRPRSNPRSRTPMRYESPLDHGAFNRAGEVQDEPQDSFQPRAISIRPGAGLDVGAVRAMTGRVHFDDTNQRPQPITIRSFKQGPSQRKSRRWNNDNFANCLHDLASSDSAKSRAAAEVLAQAKADARHFLQVYDPTESQRSAHVSRFMEDPLYKDVRERFFRGELHASTKESKPCSNNNKPSDSAHPLATDLFQRIEGRLRRVVVKACENSAPACKVVESFENFLVHAFCDDGTSNENDSFSVDFWRGILLEKPRVQQQQDKSGKTVTFLFDGDSPSGGFHRLLVHAVCQFHCLKAKTSSLQEGVVQARVLLVHGKVQGSEYRLLNHLVALQKQKQY